MELWAIIFYKGKRSSDEISIEIKIEVLKSLRLYHKVDHQIETNWMEFWDKIWDALKVKNHYNRFTTTENLSTLERRLKYVVESQQKIEQERKRKAKIHKKLDMIENPEDPEKES